jgi:hypothetical protein
VRCPNCQREVLVPGESASPLPVAAPVAPAAPPVGLFDRDDFDALLQGGAPPATESSRAPANGRGLAPPAPPPPPPAPMASVGGPVGLDRWAPSPSNAGAAGAAAGGGSYPPPNGVVLSPVLATILTVVVILLVASAFGIGVLVGRSWAG